MRIQIAILATAMLGLMMTGAMSARAALSPASPATLADVVGNWSANEECKGPGAFAYVQTGSAVQQVVRDGQREYRTPVTVKIENGFVRIQMDEKIYTFRLPTRDTLQAIKYTDSRTGLSANFSPRTWFRCS